MIFGLEDLDKALRYMLDNEEYEFKSLSDILNAYDKNKLMVTDAINYDIMLEKLAKDGYMRSLQPGPNTPEHHLFDKRFKITFEGILFIQGGGYVGAAKAKATQETAQTFAVWIAAIGTALGGVYGIVEIFQKYLPQCVPFQSLAASYVCGVCTVVCILLIRLLIRKAIKSHSRIGL